MATMLLSAAGSSIGSAAGGSLLGLGAASLGRAAGGIAGSIIDQQILGRGSAPVPTGRVDRIRVQRAGEGDPVPRVFGRIRVAGQIIWASRFRERMTESDGGGKGGGAQSASYSYTISFAVALCEGRVSGIGRLWADANEVSPSDFVHRLHDGSEIQDPDPLIEAIEGDAPAFRGLAYIVFEDVDLKPFGNRIPQFNVEVWREAEAAEGAAAPRLSELIRAVALSPGSGEFSLDTDKVRRIVGPGRTEFENVNTPSERPDLLVSLGQLAAEAPKAKAISLIVSWFGDDLRCGRCEVKPCVESRDKQTSPTEWRAGGVGRQEAGLVSSDAAGRPVFGGTPSDGSVIRAIREIARRDGRVMFYPFVLMDVPEQNAKTNPWTGVAPQPAFPWRGRITLDRAPEVANSTDKTAAAAQEVRAFFGNAMPADFNVGSDRVDYVGPAEWGFRRFILHYAHLCALAGGVDSFCIGSEMRGLTHIRSGPSAYPAVAELRSLAADVREILGPDVKIGYAADWSEYFGHQPNDGSGDVHFHLDPLWSDDSIDFVGIDNYMPIADWRYTRDHLDEGFGSPYSLQYLKNNIEGGEGFDWYYASAAAREAQDRSDIVDGAHGEDWLFRPKDIRQWWSNAHHDRPGGVRAPQPTAWTPGSKPIWFTELGCPAVDLGANQPNVFFDPKSSESFLPYFSRGVRDDFMQRRYLQATLSYWENDANNPVASLYAGRMVETSRSFVWTWDARPWPEFPSRLDVWSDGPNHRSGHWITGRLGAAPLADVVAEICRRAGVSNVDVSSLYGVVHGYMLEQAGSARAALQDLMSAYSFDAIESGETLRFRHRDRRADIGIEAGEIHLSSRGQRERRFARTPDGELASAITLTYIDDESGYESGSTEARHVGSTSTRVEALNAPLVLDAAAAQETAERHLAESRASREGVLVRLGRRHLAIGDLTLYLVQSSCDLPG
ncbi:MAG: glycoside hydrolase TIM-barrel-like domain-containing protein [Pikeienuella sp.]|uniref:baseplate multidomain protein megatron n=1 Tax=Pikeienuella sp. TaxID=2831957 RepID=UPI003918EDD0